MLGSILWCRPVDIFTIYLCRLCLKTRYACTKCNLKRFNEAKWEILVDQERRKTFADSVSFLLRGILECVEDEEECKNQLLFLLNKPRDSARTAYEVVSGEVVLSTVTDSREAKQGTQVTSKTINVHPAAKSARHSAKLLIAQLPNECARHKQKSQLLHQQFH